MKQIDTEVSPLIHESHEVSLDDSFDIKTVFGQHVLERIQKSVADVTGIAFVTVDYKGDVITEQTHFCHYCQSVRNDPKATLLCKLSDASGAIIAATNKEVSIYVCPYGLLEIAIPIIVNDQYLGGFIGGQILCHDIPDSVVRLSKNMIPSGADLVSTHVSQLSPEELVGIKQYSYTEVVSIARLVELIINQLSNQELISSRNKQKNLQRIADLERKNAEISFEKQVIHGELSAYKRRVSMMLDRNMLNVISNLCILDEAPRAYEALMDYIHIIGAKANRFDASSIKEELERIEAFIHLTNQRANQRVHCHIAADAEVMHKQIPMYALLQYIHAIVYYLLDTEESDIHIRIQAALENKEIRIVVEDDGIVLKTKELEHLNGPYHKVERGFQSLGNILDTTRITNSLEDVREALYDQYQDNYLLLIKRTHKCGLQVIIEYPALYGEDVRYD